MQTVLRLSQDHPVELRLSQAPEGSPGTPHQVLDFIHFLVQRNDVFVFPDILPGSLEKPVAVFNLWPEEVILSVLLAGRQSPYSIPEHRRGVSLCARFGRPVSPLCPLSLL